MPVYSRHSREQLDSCHKDLQRIFNKAIRFFDIRIIEGWRSQARQNLLHSKGLSQVKFPFSKHNARTPEGTPESRAVDVAPWPIDWSKVERFVLLAGRVLQITDEMYENGEVEFQLRWGGDWDRDDVPVHDDETEHFPDYGHFELVKP